MELAGAKVYGALSRRARVPNCPRASLSRRAVAPSRAQSADAHLDDLRDNVQRTLEHTGVLSEIRARLRAAVITAIMDGEPTDPPTVGFPSHCEHPTVVCPRRVEHTECKRGEADRFGK